MPRDKIIYITGHRNVLSLNSYEGDDKNQAKELSNIINGCKQNSDTQQQSTSSPNKKERLPLQASTSCTNFSTINNLIGTVNFCGGFPGVSGPSKMPAPSYQSTESLHSWKRIRAPVLSDSYED